MLFRSRVFRIGGSAFKVKRPVDFGFLDYSTLELRRWALERELTFNRAAAPDIYREVRQLNRTADGGLLTETDEQWTLLGDALKRIGQLDVVEAPAAYYTNEYLPQ